MRTFQRKVEVRVDVNVEEVQPFRESRWRDVVVRLLVAKALVGGLVLLAVELVHKLGLELLELVVHLHAVVRLGDDRAVGLLEWVQLIDLLEKERSSRTECASQLPGEAVLDLFHLGIELELVDRVRVLDARVLGLESDLLGRIRRCRNRNQVPLLEFREVVWDFAAHDGAIAARDEVVVPRFVPLEQLALVRVFTRILRKLLTFVLVRVRVAVIG